MRFDKPLGVSIAFIDLEYRSVWGGVNQLNKTPLWLKIYRRTRLGQGVLRFRTAVSATELG